MGRLYAVWRGGDGQDRGAVGLLAAVPLRGGIEAIAAGESICCDARTAAVSSPVGRREIRTDQGSARLQVPLVGDAMHRQLAALLGDWPREPLVFSAGSRSVTRGYGRGLLGYLQGAAAEFDAHGYVTWSPLVISQFEQLIMTRLLLEHPHNYADAVRRRDRLLSPRSARRAIGFFMRRQSGCADHRHRPGRGVGHRGPDPVREFPGVQGRLTHALPARAPLRAGATRALMSPLPDENVTSIAVRWGFNHMGRVRHQLLCPLQRNAVGHAGPGATGVR